MVDSRPVSRWLVLGTAVTWSAFIATALLGWWLGATRAQHPPFLPVLLSPLVQVLMTLAVLVVGVSRLLRGHGRRVVVTMIVWSITPAFLWLAFGATIHWITSKRYHPLNVWVRSAAGLGAAVGDLEIRVRYHYRTDGERV